MKKLKRLLSFALTLVMVVSMLSVCAVPTSAATYPTVMHKSMGMVGYVGDTIPLIFTYFPAYNNERITVNIYSPSGKKVANAEYDINNKYSNYGSITSTWDTTGYEPGKYNIEVVKEFYSLYQWNTAPKNSTSFVTLVKPTSKISLNNSYKGSKTHFEVRNNKSAVTASKTSVKSAYNAWQKLKVTNVSVPYQIQMTEMYIGSEAESIAVSENMYNPKNNSNCQWVLTKFEIKNNGSTSLEAADVLEWTNAYLPTGQMATVIDTCTFGDRPNYSTKIEPGETKEAWFGFYLFKKQGIPFLKLDNGAYIYTNPDCASSHKYSNSCDTKCNNCNLSRTTKHTYSNNCDKSCNVCKATRTVAHKYKTTTNKATLKKNGSTVKKCTACGATSKSTIKYAKSFKLTTTSYTYNGKVKTPGVVVKDSAGKKLKKGTDYTVTYSKGRKKVGTYKVTVKMKGKYKGTKTLTFKINPPKTSVSKLTAGKTSITVKLSKKSTQVSGYQVQYSTSKKFTSAKTKTISSYKKTSVILSGLKAKKIYYVRVRTYKKVSGKTYYSKWSSVKTKCTAHTHSYTKATCTKAKVCKICKVKNGKPLGHTNTSVNCTRCGKTIFTQLTYTGTGIGKVSNINIPNGDFILEVVATGLNEDVIENCFVYLYDGVSGYTTAYAGVTVSVPFYGWSSTEDDPFEGPIKNGTIKVDTTREIKWKITIKPY
ncbi:MAG: fibronectin type III domain-containing protein [Clostridia bacterium]|nr:fibronectin type III domain-containing protein [Clostridia bacterium]